MSYQLRSSESPAEGVRRIAREQLERALGELEKVSGPEAAVAVHEIRKHIKKVRALLRLVSTEIGKEIFAEENGRLRAVARSFSGARDAQVQLNLLEQWRDQVLPEETAFPAITTALEREITAASTDLGAEAQAAWTTLEWIGDRLEGWPLDHLCIEHLCAALKRFYRRGRRCLRAVESEPTEENFHAWRKRVKDVWYQALLLQDLNPAVLGETANAAQTLGRELGDLHDLAFFRRRLEGAAEFPADEATALLELISAQEEKLQEIVLDRGERFFAEKPKEFERRLLRYAKKWPAPAEVA